MRRVDRQRFSSNSLDTWSAPRAHFARNRGDQPSDETESRGGDAPLMRGARLHQAGKLLVADESRPVPAAGQELIAVTAVGICGSDLHWFTEGSIGDAVLNAPLILGHEIGGVIASGPRTGQRVAVDPSIPCWICPPCLDGNPNLCINIVFAGHGDTDGGMRQYLAWPSERLHQLPECRISTTGAGVMYYAAPDPDLIRRGTVWWAREPGRPVHTWRERTTVHHEGIPMGLGPPRRRTLGVGADTGPDGPAVAD